LCEKLHLIGWEFLGFKEGLPFLEGKTFDELNSTLRPSILTRPITINLIKKADRKVKFILFRRLNIGGLELKPAEIRNAVYQGVATNTLKKLTKCEKFVAITEKKILTNRMEDRDFVSRFIAFYITNYTKYESGLDDFINSNMELLEQTNFEKVEMDFSKAPDLSMAIFGTDAFRKKERKN